jgi:hypothetical protein
MSLCWVSSVIIIMLNVIMLSVALYLLLFQVSLCWVSLCWVSLCWGVVMLNDIMMSVVMSSVMAPNSYQESLILFIDISVLKNMKVKAGKTNWRERLSTFDLHINVARYFFSKLDNASNIKSSWSKLVVDGGGWYWYFPLGKVSLVKVIQMPGIQTAFSLTFIPWYLFVFL